VLIGRYTAVLDACVLHPVFVRGALLWFAAERLYRPLWSADILDEWQRSLVRKFPDAPAERFAAQRALIESQFEDAMVSGYPGIARGLDLPDPDDRHVLAAAIAGRADAIITANLKDFPQAQTHPFNVEVIHPDDFLVNAIDLETGRALAALRRHREALSTSAPSTEEFLGRFERCGLIQTHQRLQAVVDLL
jgi:predicted nucleic acid-binding protein